MQSRNYTADGAIRLVSVSSVSTSNPGVSAGRLEIYNDGRWGTVCDEGFDQTDADVVCQQLGYRRANRYGSVGNLGYDGVIGYCFKYIDVHIILY